MGIFNLEIAQEKTKIITFGRKAYADAKRQGQKPEALTFWGLLITVAKAKKENLE
jgi:hypothetical protein